MTTDTQLAPTDAEIVALMRDGYNCRYNDEADHIDFARAVLTKWGTPAPVGVEPFGIWHEGETEDESDFFLFKDSGDVACPTCIKLYTADQALAVEREPLTPREIELIDGMIAVQLDHAMRCDAIANRAMADKQKGWDMERVALLQKLKAAHGIKGGQHGADT